VSEQKQLYIVIADLDGTIALIDHRRHWLDKDRHPELTSDERWGRFFAECVSDTPNLPVIQTLKASSTVTLMTISLAICLFHGRR
jgi:hypothetical protein